MIKVYDYNSKPGRKKIEEILKRTQDNNAAALETVQEIVSDVKENGDKAVYKYTLKFNGIEINNNNIRVTKNEITEAYNKTNSELIQVIKKSIKRVSDFHMRQKTAGWIDIFPDGEIMGQMVRPLSRVGIYCPGGKTALPSSLLMCLVPAKVAGVDEIVVATPPDINGNINSAVLIVASELGVNEIYKVGGAQAVAMLAFGTESICKVDKVAGPGSIYVALAKKCVYGYVDIDSIAGPSEILIIADTKGKPEFLAADLLAQAEHGEPAPTILVTTSDKLALKTMKEIEIQLKKSPRKDIIKKTLLHCGAAFIVNSLDEAAEINNLIAPEHLSLCVKDPLMLLGKIKNAGAVFFGNYTPEALGDYMAGPSHVLPTGGTARFFSPLSVDDFVKKSSLLSFDKKSFINLSNDVCLFSEAEGLHAHANSIKIRLLNERK